MHKTCRSCHVPPPQVEPVTILTDCAVCHAPESAPPSLYKLLSGGALTLDVVFDPSVPEGERDAWREGLRERLRDTTVELRDAPAPDAAPVRVEVGVTVEPGRTDGRVGFFAARARAAVRLHRAKVEVTSRPGVAADAGEAMRKALDDLARRVCLVLSW